MGAGVEHLPVLQLGAGVGHHQEEEPLPQPEPEQPDEGQYETGKKPEPPQLPPLQPPLG